MKNEKKLNIFFFKKIGLILILPITILLDVFFTKEFFYTTLLLYIIFIKFLFSNFISIRPIFRKTLTVLIWLAFSVSGILFYYSNHFFPRGEMIDTGDVICRNDDRGPCYESFIEDTSDLDIPKWGKFFKSSGGELLLFGLLIAGLIISINKKTEYEENRNLKINRNIKKFFKNSKFIKFPDGKIVDLRPLKKGNDSLIWDGKSWNSYTNYGLVVLDGIALNKLEIKDLVCKKIISL